MSAAVDEATSPSRRPDVTVVTIAGEDRHALETTLASVAEQTLGNLECVVVGSETSAREVTAFAGRPPQPVRVVTVPGHPRRGPLKNAGVEAARAPWLLVVDAGDEIERHAAKNLLLAAESTGAVLVCGPRVRTPPGGRGRATRLHAELYDDRACVESVLDAPGLLRDTACANKLFSRAFLVEAGLRFPDVVATDSVVTTAALCAARRIAVVPAEVCRSPQDARIDITDVITAQRLVDDYLDARSLTDRRPHKDQSWLLDDLRESLAALGARGTDDRHRWLAAVAPYVQTAPAESLALAGTLPQAAAWLVAHGDVDRAVDVADLWVRGNVTPGLLVEAQERVRIRSDADAEGTAPALDVTSLGLQTAPFSRQKLTPRLRSMTLAGGQVHLDGVVTNLFGRLTSESPPTARLVARSRDGRHDVAIGRTTVAVAPDELRWQTVADAAELDLDPSVALWDLGMRIEVDGHVNVSWVTAVPGAVAFRPLPVPDAGVRGTRRLQPQTDAEWHVVVRAEQTERPGGAAARVGRRLHRSVAVRAGRRLLGAVNGRRVKGAVFRHVFTRLPVHPDVVVFESMLGRSYSDSPRYVYEELRRRNRPCRAVWSYSGSRRSWPQDAVLVRRDSWRYYYELARAAVWVDNQGLPDIVTPRAATRYLQTWHGSPLKAMGFDQPELQLGSDATRRRFARLVERWTYFCVQSPFAEEAFRRAFRHRAENLRIGYPRNDPLLAPDRDAAAAAIRARLDLPDDRRLVLYAPTFRDYRRALRAPYSLPFDLAKVGEAVGDRCFFLVRPHYLDRFVVPPRFADVARDVSAHHDMAELLLVADALVTDYSSTMFDYALLRRPMLFYAYDLDLYAMSRGTYFDLETDAPGKVVATEDALIDWLADPVQAHTHFRAAHERFLERFCTYETGHAAAAAVDRLVEEPR